MKVPTLYRITLSASIVGLVVAAVSFGFPSIPVGLMSLYFAGCWLLWIACALSEAENRAWHLAGTWFAIDVGVLAMFLSVTVSLGNVNDSQGTEMIWGISYAPMMLPFGVLASIFAGGLHFATESAPPLVDRAVDGVIANWLAFSCAALIQALSITSIVWWVRALRDSRRP